MLTIRCPGCQRLLRLPEGLGGSEVRCPGCASSFRAPDPSAALATPSVITETPTSISAPRSCQGEAFEPVHGAFYDPPHVKRQVSAAAAWLHRAGSLGFICSPLGSLCLSWSLGQVLPVQQDHFPFLFLSVFLAAIVWNSLILAGASSLERRRDYPLVVLASLLAFAQGPREWLQTGLLLLVSWKEPDCLMTVVWLFVGLSQFVGWVGMVGGIKTLSALRCSAVREGFR